MAQLIVRNIEDDVKDRLVQRARRHGHSMEEEVRDHSARCGSGRHEARAELDFGTRLANFSQAPSRLPEIEEFKGYQARPAVSTLSRAATCDHPRHQRHLGLHAAEKEQARGRTGSNRQPAESIWTTTDHALRACAMASRSW